MPASLIIVNSISSATWGKWRVAARTVIMPNRHNRRTAPLTHPGRLVMRCPVRHRRLVPPASPDGLGTASVSVAVHHQRSPWRRGSRSAGVRRHLPLSCRNEGMTRSRPYGQAAHEAGASRADLDVRRDHCLAAANHGPHRPTEHRVEASVAVLHFSVNATIALLP
jgi:hypothetical protein